MFSKVKKVLIFVLLLCFSININLFSATQTQDLTGFVINSPLFSIKDNIDDTYEFTQQSFIEQLGLMNEDSAMQNDSDITLLRAISDSNYPITPGDTFRIDYLNGQDSVEIMVQVDSEYQFIIPQIGTIDATNLTLSQIVKRARNLITTYYAFSSPQVSLISIGVFSVDVIGDVISSSTYAVNGLTRLSDVVKIASDNANTRDVQIRNKAGVVTSYDLYLALKKGEISNNPLLKVGDTIILKQATKTINVVGNVYNPGTFQIKDNETFAKIINYYCGGLLTKADTNNIYISRYNDQFNQYSEKTIALYSSEEIKNLDTIVIPSIKIQQDSVTIEGALKDSTVNNNTANSLLTMAQSKIIYNFYPGETLEEMLVTISPRFMVNSDLTHAYLLRGEEQQTINVLSYLSKNVNDDIKLIAGDRIIIPFDNKFVNVQGAVERSGTFAYEPNKKLEYYISLAGGYSQDATNSISITDSNGKKLDKNDFIPSDSTIHVKADTFRSDLSTIASIVAIVASVITILDTSIGLITGN